jgi:hypothetical protein
LLFLPFLVPVIVAQFAERHSWAQAFECQAYGYSILGGGKQPEWTRIVFVVAPRGS